jgi:hypothetical protein
VEKGLCRDYFNPGGDCSREKLPLIAIPAQ